MKIKKIIILSLIALIILHTTSFAIENNLENKLEKPQEDQTESTLQDTNNLDLYCKSCILIECSTGKIAYEKNSEQKLYPASTTKLLTAIIAMEECNLTDIVKITSQMVSSVPSGYTIAYLQPGEEYSVEELLNLLLIPSANDAGFALAIHISGSTTEFAKLMNETAKKIGCTNSNFTNPSGIHNVNHYSTAKDLSIIGLKAMEYPTLAEIGAKTSYTIKNNVFETTNTLIKNDEPNYYEYATGLKTGFTDQAGSCLVATAQKDNMKFLAVILNCPKSTANINYRDADAKLLFEYGFEHYSEIVPTIDKIINIFPKIISGENTIQNVFKIAIAFFTLFLFFIILKKKNVKNNRTKKLEPNYNWI